MIDPSEIVTNLVAMLRDVPDLVAEVGGDAERIYAYHDQYPKNVSLVHAIHAMPAPVDHGGLAGHAARIVRRHGCVEAPGHAVSAREGNGRRRSADGVLPAVPIDHQGHPDCGRRRDAQRYGTHLLLPDGPARRFSGRPIRRGWTTSKCRFHLRRLETTEWSMYGCARLGARANQRSRSDAGSDRTAHGRWLEPVRAAGQHPGGNDACRRLDCKKYKSASASASRPISRPPIWSRRCGG